MILFLLIIAVICFMYFNIIPKKGHTIWAGISLLVVFFSIVGIVAHDYNHFGMTAKTTTVKKELVSSANPKLPMLLYQPLGNGTEKIYLYKTNNAEKKPKAIQTEKTSAKVKSANKPLVTIKTTRYTYSNGWNKFMFGIFGHDNELKHRQYTFSVPKNWKILSINEAKALQKKLLKQEK